MAAAFNAIPLVQGNHQQLPFPLGVNLGGLRNGVLDSLLFLGRQLRQILRAELLLFPRFLRRFLGALLHGLFDLRTDWRRQRRPCAQYGQRQNRMQYGPMCSWNPLPPSPVSRPHLNHPIAPSACLLATPET
jgi:hypothetical protein